MNISLIALITLILGSNVVVEIVKRLLMRKQTAAGTIKLRNESGQIVLEGELKVSEFYKKEWQELLARYELLEKRFEEKNKEHESCRGEIDNLQRQHDELKRQFTLLKTQLKM